MNNIVLNIICEAKSVMKTSYKIIEFSEDGFVIEYHEGPFSVIMDAITLDEHTVLVSFTNKNGNEWMSNKVSKFSEITEQLSAFIDTIDK